MDMAAVASDWRLQAVDELRWSAIRTSAGQLLRYGLLGLATNIAGFLVYLLVTHLGAPPAATMSFFYAIGAILGFWGNKRLTFAHRGGVLASGMRYVLVHAVGYCLNLLLLLIFVNKLGYPHQWVQGAAILIVAGYLFLAFKFFVFAHPERAR